MIDVVWLWLLVSCRLRWFTPPPAAAAADYGVTSNHFRVSIRPDMLQDAPSCEHRIAQVELLNLHSTEHIVILSIRTTEEHTEAMVADVNLVSGEDDVISGESNHARDMPQQLYASKIPGGSLQLGPGQVAIVPIAFLPRFPPLPPPPQPETRTQDDNMQTEGCDDVLEVASSRSLAGVSSFQKADWRDLREGDRGSELPIPPPVQYHRNNLETESPSPYPSNHEPIRYHVSTTIVVETDRGEVELPLEVTSLRKNSFGLPDVIYFDMHDEQITEPSPEQPLTIKRSSNNKAYDDVDDDQMIEETVSLFRAVKEREKIEQRRKSDQQQTVKRDVNANTNDLTSSTATRISSSGDGSTSGPRLASRRIESVPITSYQVENGVAMRDEAIQISSDSSNDSIDDSVRKNVDENDAIVWIVDSQLQPEYQRSLVGASPATPLEDFEIAEATANAVSTKHQDCYDVYLQNPDAAALLEVTEVLLSRPEHMSLHVMPNITKESKRFSVSSSPRQVINNWKEAGLSDAVFGDAEGALRIPADGERHYLVTVCTRTDNGSTSTPSVDSASPSSLSDAATPLKPLSIPQPSSVPHNEYADNYLARMSDWTGVGNESSTLGFLQIKTTDDTLFVGLAKADESMRQSLRTAAEAARLEGGTDEPCTSSSFRDAPRPRNASMSGGAHLDDLGCEGCDVDESDLRSIPARIEFEFVSSALPKAVQSIDLVNVSPHPVTIMRAALALEQQKNSRSSHVRWSNNEEREFLGNLGIELHLDPLHVSLSSPIAAGATVASAVTVACSVDWEKFVAKSSGKLSLEIRGALVLRGTTRLDWSYLEWERKFKADSALDSNIVFELPLTIKVVKGSIGFLVQGTTHAVPSFWSMKEYSDILDIVSSAFFPLQPSFTMASVTKKERERMSPEFAKGVDHQLRVFSDIGMDIVVDEVAVVGGSSDETLSGSLCDRFDAYIVERGPSDHIDLGELTNMGLVYVRYRFPGATAFGKEKTGGEYNRSNAAFPTTCYLRVTTEPKCGVHEIPFVVYPGQIEISGNQSHSEFREESTNATIDETVSWYEVVTGFENLVEWFRNSKEGFALRSVLKASLERGTSPDRDGTLLGRYLYGLAQKSTDLDRSKLNPVLLKVGAIAQGETETLPLYMTNYNPVPVTIKIVVGEVEGQSIAIGRDASTGKGDANSLLDLLPSRPFPPVSNDKMELVEPRVRSGRFRGHPVNGLRQFLMTNNLAMRYLNEFPFRDDISISEYAVSTFPFLRKQFKTYAVGQFHRWRTPRRFTPDGWSRCDKSIHPPLYGSFQKKLALSGRRLPGPIIISNDRKTVRSLSICWDADGEPEDMKSDGTYVVVPPGGVVRFDVSIRAPPHAVLAKDITRFLTSGLVLSTDHGEIIPVLVSFEALQGKLEVAHIPSVQQHEIDGRTIQVPPGLFGIVPSIESSSIKIPPHNIRSFADFNRGGTIVPRNASFGDGGVSLFMKSSFLRDIQLRKVVSCNPWFQVFLVNQTVETEADPFLGVNIGAIRSVVSCDPIQGVPVNNTRFPSFFRCALNWLTKRAELQPRGCGLLPYIELRKDYKDADYLSERGGMDTTMQALKRALLVSEWSDELFSVEGAEYFPGTNAPFPVKSGRRGGDGVVSSIIIDAVSQAWNALQSASDAGLLSLGSSLRAVVEYNATPDEMSPVTHDASGFKEPSHLLSVAIRNVTVKTVLETPRLLNTKTPGGVPRSADSPQVVEFQPTLVANVASVRLPLRNPTAVPVRVRLAVASAESGADDSIRSRFLGDFQPPFVQTKRRTAIAPKDYANEQWWDRGGSFFHPDFHGDMIRSLYNITIKSGVGARISLVNPSFLANTAFLVGCGARCGLRNENNSRKPVESSVHLTPASPIGASAAAGRTLVGRQGSLFELGTKSGSQMFSLAAGGSLIPGGRGPSAFAIPYSVLDEIIIPPFGEAEIGPILFRPPGRTREMGCEAMKSNKKSESCESQIFESMVFLENSLTGLERVLLRGKALWEKVIFLDPITDDDFGDIELRHGHPTLVFPGHSVESSTKPLHPTLKEVVVHNEGDVTVSIARGYLSPKPKNHHNAEDELLSSCDLSHFRLVGCREPVGLFPFRLAPGQNQSIFIEHHPQCTKKREYIMLLLELDTDDDQSSNDYKGAVWPISNRSTFLIQNRAHRKTDIFRRKIALAIGYEMTDKIYESCVPLSKFSVHARQKVKVNRMPAYFRSGCKAIWSAMAVCALSFWLFILRQRLFWLRDAAKKFQSCLISQKPTDSDANPSTIVGHNWLAAFRCLARADPTASDLQSLGREQTRQIVLARYKSMGAMPPQCFSSTGVAKRERFGASSTSGRQVSAGTGTGSRGSKSSSNDRIRTSDAIFGKFDSTPVMDTGLLPVQLGWRTAATRGIIDASSLRASPIMLKTEALLRQRMRRPLPIHIQSVNGRGVLEGTKSHDDSSSDFGSSFGDLSEEDDLPAAVHEPVSEEDDLPTALQKPGIIVPGSISSVLQSEVVEVVEFGDGSHNESSDACFVRDEKLIAKNDSSFSLQPLLDLVLPSQGLLQTEKYPAASDEPKTPSVQAIAERQIESTNNDDLMHRGEADRSDSDHMRKVFIDKPKRKTDATKEEPDTSPRRNREKKKVEPARGSPKQNVSERKEKAGETLSSKLKTNAAATGATILDEKRTSEYEHSVEPKTKQTGRSARAKRGKGQGGKKGQSPSKSETRPMAILPPLSPDVSHPDSCGSSHLLRPPPGLLPPPGFESSSSIPFRSKLSLPVRPPGLSVNTYSNDDLLLPSARSTGNSIASADYIYVTRNASDLDITPLNDPVLGYAGFMDTSDASRDPSEIVPILSSILPSLPSPRDEYSRSMSDFDVMDFLDGILEEASASAGSDGAETGGSVMNTAALAGPTLPSVTAESPQLLPFSSNPWATDPSEGHITSRAAAYGISFDDHIGRIQGSTVAGSAGLPLLTPAIFSRTQEEGDDKNNSLFYANLLNE